MNSPATVEEDDAPAPTGIYRDAEGLPSPCHRDYEGKRTQFKDDDDNEEQPCFLDALPDAILQHTLAFTTSATSTCERRSTTDSTYPVSTDTSA